MHDSINIPRLMAFAIYIGICVVPAGACARKLVPAAKITVSGGAVIEAELATTQSQLQKGLMYRTDMPENAGMLFVYPRQDMRIFWMKNTWMDLDIIFIGEDKKINKIFPDVPRSRASMPDSEVAVVSAPGRYVLEMNAGFAAKHGLSAGSQLNFELNQDEENSKTR